MRRGVIGSICGGLGLGGLVFILGCGGARANTRVDDAWLARVPAEQLGGVYQARTASRQAEDEVRRQQVQHEDAQRALGVARLELKAAQTHVQSRAAAFEAARATGRGDEIGRAQDAFRASQEAEAASKAQLAWREQQVDALQAERRVAERRVEVASAQLDLAEFEALRGSGDVRAQNLSGPDFQLRLIDAQRKETQARIDAERLRRAESVARARWEQLRPKAEGYGGSGPDRR